jgi:hypothetical protein
MNDPNEFARRYVAAWNEPDQRLRRRAIEDLWAADGCFFNGRGEHAGHDAIEAAVTISHEKWIGQGYHFRSSDNADRRHDGVRFNWEMVGPDGGHAVSVGFDFVLLDDDNRIRRNYQFIDR